jgi:hypothetical protein
MHGAGVNGMFMVGPGTVNMGCHGSTSLYATKERAKNAKNNFFYLIICINWTSCCFFPINTRRACNIHGSAFSWAGIVIVQRSLLSDFQAREPGNPGCTVLK